MSKVIMDLKDKLTNEIEEAENNIELTMVSIDSWKKSIADSELHIVEKREEIKILKKLRESLGN